CATSSRCGPAIVNLHADSRKRQRADLSFLSDMRLHRLLGERRLSWICHRQLRRPKFPCADHRGVGGVTPPLGLLAARHAAQTRGEAGMIKRPLTNFSQTLGPSSPIGPWQGPTLGEIQPESLVVAAPR